MTVLDAAQYPHLIDNILSYSSWETLSTCRLVSKTVCGRVDKLQCSHIILIHTYNYDTAAMVRGTLAQHIPALRFIDPVSWSQQPPHPSIALVKDTRVLDIVGYFPPQCNLGLLVPHFKNVDMLRMLTKPETGAFTPYFPIPSKTLVLFTNDHAEPNPKPYPLDDSDWDEDEDEDEELVPPGQTGRIPPGVTKVVVNMKGTDVPIADLYHYVIDPPESVTDIVIVLLRYIEPGNRVGEIQENCMGEEIVVMDTVELIMANTDINFTLVGFDEVRPAYVSRFRRLMTDKMRTYTIDGIDEKGDNYVSCDFDAVSNSRRRTNVYKIRPEKEAYIQKILDKVTFMSIGEYAKSNGRTHYEADMEFIEYI